MEVKMNIFVLALLVFAGFYGAKARAIDDENLDNTIETESPQPSDSLFTRTRLGLDWVKFTKLPPVKLTQMYGSPVEISCEVMGSPLPTVQWVVGNMPLSEIDTFDSNVISEASTSAIVKIRSVHIVEHGLTEPRTYTCVGSTGSRTIYASTTVYPQSDSNGRVDEKPFTGQVKPHIVYNEKMHLDLEGSNIVLPCKVHARPKAEVFWMNGEGNRIEQNHRYKLLPSGDLLIADLKWEDMGTYKCIARNMLGKDTADSFIYPVKKDQ